MKWEFQLYTGFGFLIVILLVIQTYLLHVEKPPYSQVSAANTFNQLLVDIECNVYLLEGEKQNILVEGPNDKIRNIETIYNEGCITIRENSNKMLSRMMNLINNNQEPINVYITVNNLDDFHIHMDNQSPEVKYSAEDIIGVTLKYGNSLILESKRTKSCV
jgi:5S rRNA maturation endonuclease (ribonuclease M5)